MADLAVRNLSFEAGGKRILHPCSFEIASGRFIALLGPSGSGKSTLLKALNGLVRPASGTVLFDGRNIWDDPRSFRRAVGFVPQDDIIHTGLTVERALYYSARLRLKPRSQDSPAKTSPGAAERPSQDAQATLSSAKKADATENFYFQRVQTVMEQLELTGRRDVVISSLSGGQRKRVSVGVELLTAPPMISLDEPTSGLDPALESKMMALFRKLADGGRTLLVTTHSMDSLEMADAVMVLAEGRLVYAGCLTEAMGFFEVLSPRDIFQKLSKAPACEWERLFHAASGRAAALTVRL